jgi:4-amino-4-deoxy-L-arabinose transferase-like glycosyltransferase
MMRNGILFAIVIVALILGSARLTRGHEWGDDFASYIMQTKSIWDGTTQQFIEDNSFTIFESSAQIGPVSYPWGYPLILTPMYAIKGNSPLALKLPGLLFFGGFLICLYLLVSKRLTSAEGLLFVSLFAVNPMLIDFLDQILSDIPFLFFSTLALALLLSERSGPLYYVLLGAAIASAFFIRTPGLLLLASFLIIEAYKLWRDRATREWFTARLRNILIVLFTFSVLWAMYALLFPGGGESYFEQYQAFRWETMLGFISGYFQVFSLFFGESVSWRYLYYLLCIFFLIGLWTRRKNEPVFLLFFALWMILLITWPFWQGPRFIFPLLPIFIYFTFHGMKVSINKLPQAYHRTGQAAFYGFWLFIIGAFLFTSGTRAFDNARNGRTINGPYDPVSREMYEFLQDETPSDSVVVFFKPRAMRLMTGRDTLMIYECAGLLKGDFVALSKKVGENNQVPPERIDSCNLPLEEVFENRRFVIYEITQ